MFWNTKNNNDENISYLQKIIDLKEQYIEELETIRSVAQSDIERWNSYLHELAISPVSQEGRVQAKAKGIAIPAIAFPSEYRAVLVAFNDKTKTVVKALNNSIQEAGDATAAYELEKFTDKHVKKLIKKELKRYLELTKPKVSVTDIFANASKSINKFSPKEVGDKSYSVKCKTCGAARLKEDQYDECFYCGTPLFKKQ